VLGQSSHSGLTRILHQTLTTPDTAIYTRTMDSRLVLPAVLLVLCSLVDTGSGIECYQCNSYEDALCGDPFKFEDGKKEVKSGEDYLKPCEIPEGVNQTTQMFCRKLYQNVRSDVRVIRSCGWIHDEKSKHHLGDEAGRDCYTTVLEEYNTEVCECYDDKCNSATMSSMSVTVAILSSVVLGYLIH